MARKDSTMTMRQILINRRDALRKALAGDLSQLKELSKQTSGGVDQDEINSQLAEVESRELALIENALEQMRNGQYGLCENCNVKIPIARLRALPYATLCIECQRDLERNGGGRGSDVDWGRVFDSTGGDVDMTINELEIDVP